MQKVDCYDAHTEEEMKYFRENGTNNSPPDIAAQSRDLPPDLGAESRTPLDLLSPEGGGDALLVDLTEGAPSSDQASRQTPT